MAEPSQPAQSQAEPSSSTTVPTSQKPPDAAVEDDSDPDFDDLDDVLDQFSAATSSQPKPQSEPTPSSSGPGRPPAATTTSETSTLPSDLLIPEGPRASESEEEFMARLTAEMSSVMSKLSADPAASATTPDDIAKMGRELEEFTAKMEAEGVQPEDLLKAILGEDTGTKVGEIATKERERRESQSQSRSPEKSKTTKPESSSKGKSSGTSTGASFEDTIRKTMARMESSSAAASSATAQSAKSEEDMLAEMLRALDSEGAGEGGDGDADLSKMFLGMMEQLTNKDMLYEPMKELSTKFPDWLDQNKGKVPTEEYQRFTRQQAIVNEIVGKFESTGYSDDDPKCREYVWEKMQAMQAEGAPPEDLVANPFPGMGMPDVDDKALEEGCPTQ
ncbi:Peroxisome chaperone and import receptor [Exophiala xenobiotica]|nr:Peroxisome chaperone and import receptor [Exophiala xenobiotica]